MFIVVVVYLFYFCFTFIFWLVRVLFFICSFLSKDRQRKKYRKERKGRKERWMEGRNKERKDEHGVKWVRGSGRRWGRETVIRIYCMKKLGGEVRRH